jgi:NAD(P)-dependent dehydrogenase (short-subunit alcohol dehydrogenase family)
MRVEGLDATRIARVFAVNVTGSFLCCRQTVRRMSTKRGGAGGAIVNVSSVAIRVGSPGEYVDYAAANGAVGTFTVGLAREVAEEGIRVNAIRPGFIYADIHASGGEPGAGEPGEGVRPHEAGRAAEGGGGRDLAAAVRRGVVRDRLIHRPCRRAVRNATAGWPHPRGRP